MTHKYQTGYFTKHLCSLRVNVLEDEIESLAQNVGLDELVEIIDWDYILSHRRVKPEYQLVYVVKWVFERILVDHLNDMSADWTVWLEIGGYTVSLGVVSKKGSCNILATLYLLWVFKVETKSLSIKFYLVETLTWEYFHLH